MQLTTLQFNELDYLDPARISHLMSFPILGHSFALGSADAMNVPGVESFVTTNDAQLSLFDKDVLQRFKTPTNAYVIGQDDGTVNVKIGSRILNDNPLGIDNLRYEAFVALLEKYSRYCNNTYDSPEVISAMSVNMLADVEKVFGAGSVVGTILNSSAQQYLPREPARCGYQNDLQSITIGANTNKFTVFLDYGCLGLNLRGVKLWMTGDNVTKKFEWSRYINRTVGPGIADLGASLGAVVEMKLDLANSVDLWANNYSGFTWYASRIAALGSVGAWGLTLDTADNSEPHVRSISKKVWLFGSRIDSITYYNVALSGLQSTVLKSANVFELNLSCDCVEADLFLANNMDLFSSSTSIADQVAADSSSFYRAFIYLNYPKAGRDMIAGGVEKGFEPVYSMAMQAGVDLRNTVLANGVTFGTASNYAKTLITPNLNLVVGWLLSGKEIGAKKEVWTRDAIAFAANMTGLISLDVSFPGSLSYDVEADMAIIVDLVYTNKVTTYQNGMDSVALEELCAAVISREDWSNPDLSLVLGDYHEYFEQHKMFNNYVHDVSSPVTAQRLLLAKIMRSEELERLMWLNIVQNGIGKIVLN